LGYIYDVDYLDESYIVASASGLTTSSSTHIITLTISTAAGSTTPSAVTTVAAGKTQKITFILPAATIQANVPVYFLITAAYQPPGFTACASISCYAGGFPSASQASATTDSTGTATATLTVDTRAGYAVVITPKYALSPTSNSSVAEPATGQIQTIAATPSQYSIVGYFDSTFTSGAKLKSGGSVVNGTTVFIDVKITDSYGNLATNPGPGQIGINLALNPASPAGGTLSTTFAFIAAGVSDTLTSPSFGAIYWVMPKTIGTSITLTASGASLTAATFSVKTVSATPVFTVTSPKPLSGVIYANALAVVFSGYANASKGFASAGSNAVTMATLGYKVGTGTWKSITLSGSNPVWSVAATMVSGKNTVSFNVTDTKGDVSAVQSFTVLVDTSPPTITATTAAGASLTNGAPVVFSIVDSLGDLNASSVKADYNGTAVASSGITITGTNNPGSSVTYTVNVAGIPTGHWKVTLKAADLAGNTATAVSVTVFVIVPFATSQTISGAAKATIGGYTGISATVLNGWTTSETEIMFAVFKNSAGQTVAVATGGLTLAAGASGTAFAPLLAPLAPGTYTVSVFIVTTSNLPDSATATLTYTS